jgi:hypothetical protein
MCTSESDTNISVDKQSPDLLITVIKPWFATRWVGKRLASPAQHTQRAATMRRIASRNILRSKKQYVDICERCTEDHNPCMILAKGCSCMVQASISQ